jgi:hypothetical protein
MSYAGIVGEGGIRVTAWISEEPADTFVYTYQIENTTSKRAYIQWEVLDIAASGSWNGMQLFVLDPQESREFVLRSKLLPVEVDRQVKVLKEHDDESIAKRALERESGFTASSGKNPTLVFDMGFGATGFLPRKYLDEMRKRD